MKTIEMIEVMQAFVDGDIIQYRVKDDVWRNAHHLEDDLGWDWDTVEYRIKPESLEDRINAEYPDYDVVVLEWEEGFLSLKTSSILNNNCHIYAKSMRGFYKYVYFNEECNDLYTSREPTDTYNGNTIHPKAVLFTKAAK